MVGSSVVMDLMDWYSGVDDVGLDSLLVNNRLNGLMDVVVDVLAANSGCGTLAVSGILDNALVLEGSLLSGKVSLGSIGVPVVEFTVLNGTELSSVLLGENLTILYWLHSTVVVILVDLLVNSSENLLVNMRLDDLLLHCRSNSLVDGGVMVARVAHEVVDCCLSFVHFDECWCV